MPLVTPCGKNVSDEEEAVVEGCDVARFARELRERIEEQGAAALERADWAEHFWALGFNMDCGHSYEERYGLALRDVQGLRRGLSSMDDVQALGDACFSQCRYITHWAMGSVDERVEWLKIALARLEELAGTVTGGAPVVVAYRFAGAVERAIRDFCERALPGEPVPWRVEYRVGELGVCDVCMDEVSCLLPMRTCDVSLGFTVTQSTWRRDLQEPEDLAPVIGDARAERIVCDGETGDDVELAWDGETGTWKRVGEAQNICEDEADGAGPHEIRLPEAGGLRTTLST